MDSDLVTYAVFDGDNQISAGYDSEHGAFQLSAELQPSRPEAHVRQITHCVDGKKEVRRWDLGSGKWGGGGKLEVFDVVDMDLVDEAAFEPGQCPCSAHVEARASAAGQVGLDAMSAAERKAHPVFSGVLRYFPDALVAVASVSKAGNEQHHGGGPMRWDKSKSADEGDALVRHLLKSGTRDTDGQRHSAKVAWRALALLQREIDAERGITYEDE